MTVVSNSIALMIMKGIPSAPLDPNSAEAPMESLDLLDSTGLGLLTEGWSPAIAPLKNGGLWVDSATIDGRALLSDNVGNVVETMQVTCSSSLIANRLAILKKLGRLARMARAFHSTSWQINPVYLKWAAACNNGLEQYALLYNIDWAINGDTLDPMSAWDVTLTMEREPYWRGLWPGANPIEWTFQAQGKTRGVQSPNEGYTYSDMALHQNQNHLKYQAIKNAHEWNTTYAVRQNQNFITIPAANIPGDAPALCCITIDTSSANAQDSIFIAKRTAPLSKNDQSGDLRAMAFTLNGSEATSLSTLTVSADAVFGLRSLNSATKELLSFTILTGNAGSATWRNANNKAMYPLQLMRGTWLMGIRAWQNHGADGDVVAKITVKELSDGNNYAEYVTAEAPIPDVTVSDEFIFVPIGVVKLPLAANSVASLNGRGAFVSDTTDNDLQITLTIRNTVGTSVSGEVLDVVFIPYDEGCIQIMNANLGQIAARSTIFDNTGYFSHGMEGSFGYFWDQDIDYHVFSAELRGSTIELTPGIDNHLMFLFAPSNYGATNSPLLELPIRLNIIPRWSSVRDV